MQGLFKVTVDTLSFRDALARFATGVCVVTSVAEHAKPCGVTITAFASVSLKPPLVLFCLGKKSANLAVYSRGVRFAINVLSEDQSDVSDLFASQIEDRFATVPYESGKNGCPLLSGCLANLECTRAHTYEGGDHLVIVGHVDRIRIGEANRPLLRFQSKYVRIDGVGVMQRAPVQQLHKRGNHASKE